MGARKRAEQLETGGATPSGAIDAIIAISSQLESSRRAPYGNKL